MSGVDVVVQFSTGRGSFAAAVRAIERYGADRVSLLFADTAAEDVDNYRFLAEAPTALGVPVHVVKDGRSPWDVADDEGMIPNSRVPLCSRVLKHEPARRWLAEHAPDALLVVGLGWHETHRAAGVTAGWAPWQVWLPMCEPPYLDGPAVDALIRSYGIEPPRMYAWGYEHANCAGACLRAGQGAWAHLLHDSPALYAENERREEAFRARTGKDVSIHRWRSGPLVGKALPLRVLRERIEAAEVDTLDLGDWGGCGCTTSAPVEAAPVGARMRRDET